MEQTEEQKANSFLTSIYQRAWNDNLFLKELVKDPIAALNKFTGLRGKLPAGRVLIVEDQTNPNHIYLNIPTKPKPRDNQELNESQLDQISGATNMFSSHFWNYQFLFKK